MKRSPEKCRHVIAAHHVWYRGLGPELTELTGDQFVHVEEKEKLTISSLNKLRPRYIFFPHWSFIIPSEIFERYECVIFHMTDLPFGRGGSPLQNLISRGIYETKISAIRCEAELDAGPIYLKKSLCLHGSAGEIYLRAATTIRQMIAEIVRSHPQPIPQRGQPSYFKRRTPAQSEISGLETLVQVFDTIRMLDAQDYPHAFLKTGKLRLEFQRATLSANAVKAEVQITLNKDTDES